jgi:hypothetical protein
MATTDRENQIQSIGTYLGDIEVKPIDSVDLKKIPEGILRGSISEYGEGSKVKFTANLKPNSNSKLGLINDDLQYYGTPIALKVGDKTHFFMKDVTDLSGTAIEEFLPIATMQPNRSIIDKIISNKKSNITQEGEEQLLKSKFTEVDKNDYPNWISKNDSIISVFKNNDGNYRVTKLNDEKTEVRNGIILKNNISQHYSDLYFNKEGDILLETKVKQEIYFNTSSTGQTLLKSIDGDLTQKKVQLEAETMQNSNRHQSKINPPYLQRQSLDKSQTEEGNITSQPKQNNVIPQTEEGNIVVTHREKPNSQKDKLNNKNFSEFTPVENPLESNIPVGSTTLGNIMTSAQQKGANMENINCLTRESPKTLVIRCADASEAEAVKNALKEKGIAFKEVPQESKIQGDENLKNVVGKNVVGKSQAFTNYRQ